MSNYPDNFTGIKGEEEETHLFYLQGEPAIEHFSEEEAEEELLDVTVRELVSQGFITIE